VDLDFLDGLAPELKSWLTHRSGCLMEERPEAIHWATIDLRAAYRDEGSIASGRDLELISARRRGIFLGG